MLMILFFISVFSFLIAGPTLQTLVFVTVVQCVACSLSCRDKSILKYVVGPVIAFIGYKLVLPLLAEESVNEIIREIFNYAPWMIGAMCVVSLVFSTFFALFNMDQMTKEYLLPSKINTRNKLEEARSLNKAGEYSVFSKPNVGARLGVKCRVCGDTHYVPNAGIYACPNMTDKKMEFDARKNSTTTSSDDYLIGFAVATAMSDSLASGFLGGMLGGVSGGLIAGSLLSDRNETCEDRSSHNSRNNDDDDSVTTNRNFDITPTAESYDDGSSSSPSSSSGPCGSDD